MRGVRTDGTGHVPQRAPQSSVTGADAVQLFGCRKERLTDGSAARSAVCFRIRWDHSCKCSSAKKVSRTTLLARLVPRRRSSVKRILRDGNEPSSVAAQSGSEHHGHHPDQVERGAPAHTESLSTRLREELNDLAFDDGRAGHGLRYAVQQPCSSDADTGISHKHDLLPTKVALSERVGQLDKPHQELR